MPFPGNTSDGLRDSQSSSGFFGVDMEKLIPWVMSALILYAAIRSLFEAATRPLWFDEIATTIIVRQNSVSAMWRALSRGVDGQPLTYYLIERLASLVTRNEQISFRIPSILAFSCLTICLFAFIRKRSGNTTALICSAIPLFTLLFDPFAVEARPYSVVTACLAIALVCYQHAPSARCMILMGLSFALAQAFHYYSIISFIPFVVAETVWMLTARRIRWGVWLAFSCGLLPLVCYWRPLSRLRNYYGTHYWAVASWDGATSSYAWFFNTTIGWGKVLAAVAAIAVLAALLFRVRKTTETGSLLANLLQEPILILGLLALPFVGFAVAKLSHGGMTPRYTLSTVLGFSLAGGYVLPQIKRSSVVLLAVIALLLAFGLQEKRFWTSYSTQFVSPAKSVQELVTAAGYPELPVVVSDPHDFLQLAHYSPPAWNKRFVSLVDPPNAVIYSGSDSADLELQVMRDFAPLQIYDFDKFAAEHTTFLLYSSNAGQGLDWWGARLFRSGYDLKMAAQKDYYHRVLLVTLKKNSR
jgi:4-amino-4-deoxy-L-arabinose transferase-like glycosyltransferase